MLIRNLLRKIFRVKPDPEKEIKRRLRLPMSFDMLEVGDEVKFKVSNKSPFFTYGKSYRIEKKIKPSLRRFIFFKSPYFQIPQFIIKDDFGHMTTLDYYEFEVIIEGKYRGFIPENWKHPHIYQD